MSSEKVTPEEQADQPHVLFGPDGRALQEDLETILRNAMIQIWAQDGALIARHEPLAASDPVPFGRGMDWGFAALILRLRAAGLDVAQLLRNLGLLR